MFNSQEELIAWVHHHVGRSVGCVVIIKRSKSRGGDVYKIVFMCEHSGVYKSNNISNRHIGTKNFGILMVIIT